MIPKSWSIWQSPLRHVYAEQVLSCFFLSFLYLDLCFHTHVSVVQHVALQNVLASFIVVVLSAAAHILTKLKSTCTARWIILFKINTLLRAKMLRPQRSISYVVLNYCRMCPAVRMLLRNRESGGQQENLSINIFLYKTFNGMDLL